jgi:type IV pilus assembly protein PilQ
MSGKSAFCGIVLFTAIAFFIPFSLAQEASLDNRQTKEELSEVSESGLITMDFKDADVRDVIKVIAIASGVNMIIGKDVQASVTISLKDVPWEKALDVILRTYNFTYKKEENLIRIMTFEKVKQEEREIPLITKIIYLNFADVKDMKATLTKSVSDRGSIEIDARTNSMIITDIPTKVEELEKIAKKLDTRTPQVLIEAMLVDVKLTKDDQLGINWKILSIDKPESQFGVEENFIEQPQAVMNAISTPSINLGFLKRIGAYGIDGLVSAWVRDSKATVLASPKIVTLDNQTAKIEIKSQVAYTETTTSTESSSALSTTQFKDVITSLEVTPHITKEGFISMNVRPKQEFVEDTVNNQPQIATRSAVTNVLVEDGETIVIGGLRKVAEDTNIQKVPLLGDLPLIGRLFRRKEVNKENTELVMFVTPRIIVHPKLTDEEIYRYKMLDEEREEFLRTQRRKREARLKKRKKQVLLMESELVEIKPPHAEELAEEIELPSLPKIKEEEIEQELEKGTDYIYSW